MVHMLACDNPVAHQCVDCFVYIDIALCGRSHSGVHDLSSSDGHIIKKKKFAVLQIPYELRIHIHIWDINYF